MIHPKRLLAAGGLVWLAAAPALAGDEAGFRVRSDVSAPLNADTGWAGGLNEAVTVDADRPFRLRLLAAPGAAAGPLRLEYRRNDGPWAPVEAHDFPLPERSVELTFEDAEPGSAPGNWRGGPSGAPALGVTAIDGEAVLLADAGDGAKFALYDAPWPLEAFSLAAQFKLMDPSSGGFGLVFSYVDADNHARVRFNPASDSIRVITVANGETEVLAERAAPLPVGEWLEAEIEREDGVLSVDFQDGALSFDLPLQSDLASEDLGVRLDTGAQVAFREIAIDGEAKTPRVSVVATPAYPNGAAATPLLTEQAAPGVGVSLSESAPAAGGGLAEYEWPLVIRRFADGAVTNEPGDRFEFRLIDASGAAVNAGPAPVLTLTTPDGHLGGTYVETPGRIGPWQASNGDLYFIMEPAETDNLFMMVKSEDGGRSWREVDAANRPATGDLEGVDARRAGDVIHIIHQITQASLYHRFNLSDHPTAPDRWAVRDERAATADAVAQTVALETRPDGGLVIVFLGDKLQYALRSPDGGWSEPRRLDPDAAAITAGPQAVRDREGGVHIAYFEGDGAIWHRRIGPDGVLSDRLKIAEGAGTSRAVYGAVLPLAYIAESDTVVIAYRLEDGGLWERRLSGDGALTEPVRISDRPVITDAVDAQQPAADIVADGAVIRALFVDEETRSIFSADDCNGWRPAKVEIDGVKGSWVRGAIFTRDDGVRVYGYVYDAGSQGGAGLNRYAEIELPEAGCP